MDEFITGGAGRIAKGGQWVTEVVCVLAVLLSLVLLLRSFLAAGIGVVSELVTCAVLPRARSGVLSEVSDVMSGRNRSLGSADRQTRCECHVKEFPASVPVLKLSWQHTATTMLSFG